MIGLCQSPASPAWRKIKLCPHGIEILPKLLLNLRNVPDDEAHEVLELMHEHRIDSYEIPPGPFGITAGSIWLKHEDDYSRARELMDEYQAERTRRVRAEHEQARREGRADSMWSAMRRHPVRMLVYAAVSIIILMFFFAPLVVLWRAG